MASRCFTRGCGQPRLSPRRPRRVAGRCRAPGPAGPSRPSRGAPALGVRRRDRRPGAARAGARTPSASCAAGRDVTAGQRHQRQDHDDGLPHRRPAHRSGRSTPTPTAPTPEPGWPRTLAGSTRPAGRAGDRRGLAAVDARPRHRTRSRCCSTCPATSCTGTTRSRTWPASWHGALAGDRARGRQRRRPRRGDGGPGRPPADLGGGRRPLDARTPSCAPAAGASAAVTARTGAVRCGLRRPRPTGGWRRRPGERARRG